MRISELSEGPRPNYLLHGMEGLIQGLKILVSLALAVLIPAAGILVLHLSDESLSEKQSSYRPMAIEPIYQLDLGEPDGLVVLRTRRQILLRDLEGGELLESLPALPHILASSQWNPPSQQLILGYSDGRVGLLKRDESWTIQHTAHIHQDDIRSIAVSPDGRLAATGSSDRLCVWDLQQGQLLAETTQLKGGADALEFSPDQKRLLAGTDIGKVQILRTKSLEVLKSFDLGSGAISDAAFFANGEKVLAGNLHGGLFVLDVNRGETIWQSQCCRLHMIALDISPDQSVAAFSDWSNHIHLLSLETFERIDSFVGHNKPASTVQFSRDGKDLYSTSYDGTVRVWDVDSFAELTCYRGTLPEADK